MMKAKKRLTNFSSNPYKTNIKLKTMKDKIYYQKREFLNKGDSHGDNEGIRHDRKCTKCGQIWGCSKGGFHKLTIY